jgi:hypothetical protein
MIQIIMKQSHYYCVVGKNTTALDISLKSHSITHLMIVQTQLTVP